MKAFMAFLGLFAFEHVFFQSVTFEKGSFSQRFPAYFDNPANWNT